MPDLAIFDTRGANEGAEFTFLDPRTGEPYVEGDGKPLTIRLAGWDSDRAVQARRENDLRRLKTTRRAGEVDFDLEEDLDLTLLAKCTLSWDGVTLHGENLELNLGNAKRLYGAVPALRAQVTAFIGNRVNFYKAAS